MKNTVFIEKCNSYDDCEPVVHNLLDKLYVRPFVPQNFNNVLIKPNLMMHSPDRRCVTTNSKIIKAVESWVQNKQSTYLTRDNFNQFYSIYDNDLKDHIKIAKSAIDASLIINVPKLKSHYLLKITCAVKNMFGCVAEKKKWHYKTNLSTFARMIYKACAWITPQFVLVDAIDVLEGFGPGPRGVPKHMGYLIAGTNPVEVDLAILTYLGLSKDQSPVHKYSDISSFAMGGFDVPNYGDWEMDLPEGTGEFYLEADNKCSFCQKCSDICPAKAIIPANVYKAVGPIFTNKCIKCCVCLEFCPEGAIGVKVHRRLK